MSKKKIFLGLGVFALALATIPLFAAFEAHVINVTARIENALQVSSDAINFGTVFPQEELDRSLVVALSESFKSEDRVDDVEYIIRQKPKCAWTINEGQEIIGETLSGHVDDSGNIVCPEAPEPPVVAAAVLGTDNLVAPSEPKWGALPLLCPYLSKHPDNTPDNDGSLDAFHAIGATSTQGWIWTDVNGRLAKSENDFEDDWTIDLKVPCFGDHCAQDWEEYVQRINPNALPADQWVQPIKNEHKIFGCDLWVEVTGVSEVGEQPLITPTPTTTPQ